jgi:hypothetical protein
MADDREWARINTHFQDGFFRRNPSPPQRFHEGFFDSLEGTLRDALEGRSIDFVELAEGKGDDRDDFGSALILAGGHLYRIRVRNDQLQFDVIGALVGGVHSEEIRLSDGQIVETTITYEHPRLDEFDDGPLVFTFPPKEADRYVALRRRFRIWGRRGLRVWGARTICTRRARRVGASASRA